MRDSGKNQFPNVPHADQRGPGPFKGVLEGLVSAIHHPSFMAKVLHLDEISMTMCQADSSKKFPKS